MCSLWYHLLNTDSEVLQQFTSASTLPISKEAHTPQGSSFFLCFYSLSLSLPPSLPPSVVPNTSCNFFMGWCELYEITSLDLAAVYPKFILACFTTSEGLSGYGLSYFVANGRRPFSLLPLSLWQGGSKILVLEGH